MRYSDEEPDALPFVLSLPDEAPLAGVPGVVAPAFGAFAVVPVPAPPVVPVPVVVLLPAAAVLFVPAVPVVDAVPGVPGVVAAEPVTVPFAVFSLPVVAAVFGVVGAALEVAAAPGFSSFECLLQPANISPANADTSTTFEI